MMHTLCKYADETKKDCHNNIPRELLLSWTPEQLDYIHDIEYWRNIVSKSKDSEIVSLY